jgi:hypothetical protein
LTRARDRSTFGRTHRGELQLKSTVSLVLAATWLAACSSSSNAPPDAGARDAHDGAASETGGDTAADGKAHDAADAPASDASDGGSACTPACAADKACVGGACLPAPVVLAGAPGCGAARLALAGGRVYWTEHATGVVRSVAVTSPATPSLVASNQLTPGPIAADDVAVYWSNDGDGTIMKASLAAAVGVDGGASDAGPADGGAADGGAAPLLTPPAPPKGLLATGGFLYYDTGPSTLRVARTGGTPTTLATFATCKMSTPVALAVDATYVYQTDTLSQFITRARNDGTQLVANPCVAADAGAPQIAAPETLSHSQGELYLGALYRAGDEVVWADHTNIYAKLVEGAITSREVANSAGENIVTGFVVTGASVYLAEGVDPVAGPTSYTVQVAPLGTPDGGDTPVGAIVAVDQMNASSFAADATRVYWTTHTPSATAGAPDDCQIVSLAK